MEKEEFLLKLAREELEDEQIRKEFQHHYQDGGLKQAKWDLQTIPMCCMSTALLACKKLTDIVKAPCLGA